MIMWNRYYTHGIWEADAGDGSGSGGSGDDSGGSGDTSIASDTGKAPEGDSGASGTLLSDDTKASDDSGVGSTSDSYHSGLWDANGTIDKDKFDSLPDHLKGSKELFAKYDTVDALLGGMQNLANLAGKKGLQPLPEGAPDAAQSPPRQPR